MRRWIFRAIASVVAGLGCEPSRESSEPPPAAPPTIDRPEIDYAGCGGVTAAGCVRYDTQAGPLRVWLDVPPGASIDVRVDGLEAELLRDEAEGGVRLQIAVPPDATQVSIDGVDPRWSERWELQLEPRTEPPAVRRGDALRREGDVDGALEVYREALKTAAGPDALRILQALAQLHHQRRQPRALISACEQRAELAAEQGDRLAQAHAASMAAHAYIELLHDNAAAQAWLPRIRAHATVLVEARGWAAYSTALLEARRGRSDAALRALAEARRAEARYGSERTAGRWLREGQTLAELGRGDEARHALHEAMNASDAYTCNERARLLNTAGYTQLVLAEQGIDHDSPWPLLEATLEAVDEDGECPDPTLAADATVNLALAALEAYQPEDALRYLEGREFPDYLVPWVEEIRARAGVMSGRWDLVSPVIAIPAADAPLNLRWAAHQRRGAMLEQLGLLERAVEAHQAAELLLDEGLNGVGASMGAELFLAGRSQSARDLVRLLVQTHRPSEALCRARIARGRALRRLDRSARLGRASESALHEWRAATDALLAARDAQSSYLASAWTLPADEQRQRSARLANTLDDANRRLDAAFVSLGATNEAPSCEALPPIAPDESLLLPFDLGTDWVVFIADSATVSALIVPSADHRDVLETLVSTAPTRLRVLPTGRSWNTPFHALELGGERLLDHKVISYSLDLPANPRGAAPALDAAVFADPTHDLPSAHREADLVVRALESRGFEVAMYRGDTATRRAVEAEAVKTTILHFAGHAEYSGVEGWRASLPLPDGDSLSIMDIMALRRVPPIVLLTGCQTGRVATETIAGGMNLGRAFILGGAEEVLVAEGDVADSLAQQVGSQIYAGNGTLDLPAGLQHAQKALQASGAKGWESFRVISR